MIRLALNYRVERAHRWGLFLAVVVVVPRGSICQSAAAAAVIAAQMVEINSSARLPRAYKWTSIRDCCFHRAPSARVCSLSSANTHGPKQKLFFNMQSRAIITGPAGGSCQSKDRQTDRLLLLLSTTLSLLSPFCPSFNQTHMAFECGGGGALQAASAADYLQAF